MRLDDIWVFVCTIANSVKMFVLDCVEKVKEAASWVSWLMAEIPGGWLMIMILGVGKTQAGLAKAYRVCRVPFQLE